MLRFLTTIAVAFLVASCDQPAAPPPGGSTPPAPPPASSTPTTPSKPATPEIKPAVETSQPGIPGDLKKAVATAEEEAKKTAAAAEGHAKEVAASAKGAASDVLAAIPGMEGLTETSFSADKLKGLIANLKPEQLQAIADKLVAAIKEKTGNLGGLADLAKSGTGAADVLKSLKEKLTVVVDKLKASGIDVSKYTSFLN